MARIPFRISSVGRALVVGMFLVVPASIALVYYDHAGAAALLWAASFPVLAVGSILARKSGADQLSDDPRPPILFLRPFTADRGESPAYRTFFDTHLIAYVLLVIGALSLAIASVDPALRYAKAHPGRFGEIVGASAALFLLGCFALVFVPAVATCYRWFLGSEKSRLELDLGYCFGPVGPFVAIGRPGDAFAPPGAARIYLGDDAWQATVLDLMARAQAVILCPSSEGWTWWELCQVRKVCEPERVLLAFPRRYPRSLWKQLEARLAGELGVRLPPSFRRVDVLGISLPIPRRRAPFYRLDREWNAIPLPIAFRPWLLRPFLFHHMSVTTFGPFLEGLARLQAREGSDPPGAIPPRPSESG